jgi:hypothetical protein
MTTVNPSYTPTLNSNVTSGFASEGSGPVICHFIILCILRSHQEVDVMKLSVSERRGVFREVTVRYEIPRLLMPAAIEHSGPDHHVIPLYFSQPLILASPSF